MYLLDTNILLWFRLDDKRLPKSILTILKDPDEPVYYSIANSWEISIKNAKGKLALPELFFTSLPAQGFDCIAIEEKHMTALCALPPLNGDPFDRMLVAQAKAEQLTLITSDKHLVHYPIKTLLVKT